MGFPLVRMRRLRQSASIRKLVRETSLSSDDFVLPQFVRHGTGIKREVSSMPEVYQLSVDKLVEECAAAYGDGITAVFLSVSSESSLYRYRKGSITLKTKMSTIFSNMDKI